MRTQVIFFLTFFGLLVTGCCKKTIGVTTTAGEQINRSNPAKTIAWEQASLKKLAPVSGSNIGYCGYPRMIQLYDKSLICVYEVAGGSIECIKSFDAGDTWSAPVIVTTQQNNINMSVPEILELNDHSLLVSYNPRPRKSATSGHFGIRTKKSYDGGLTWKDERLVYEAGAKFEDGCWEPAQIQLPSGEIQLFFSDEGIYTSSNEQNISVFRSVDNGLTWTTKPQIVSFRAGKRDGMPVPILLKGGKEILFSIEDNAVGEFKPSIIRSTIVDNWKTVVVGTSEKRNAALLKPLHDTIYAGAPYLRQLKAGETILSYQGTEGRMRDWNHACMFVVVGDAAGKNFTNRSIPFNVPLNKQGLWNSLCVLDDNTVIALTSTNAYSANTTEVWMIKGRLVN